MPGVTLATWNMQGGTQWGEVGTLVKDADVVCLQECGAPPTTYGLSAAVNGVRTATVSFGTKKRSRDVFMVFLETPSKNLAILCDPALTTQQTRTQANVNAGLRPLLGVELTAGKPKWVYSIHAPSGNHNAAAGSSAVVLNNLASTWVVAGDFNCSEDELDAARQRHGGTWKISSSGLLTRPQSGNELDLVVTESTVSAQFISSGNISDHAQLFFSVF